MNHRGPINETLRLTLQACASVEVRLADGSLSIGAAFHVGDSVFLTARHVLEGNEIVKITPSTSGYLLKSDAPHAKNAPKVTMHYGDEETEIYNLRHGTVALADEPIFHSNSDVDVAAFRLTGLDPDTPELTLGGHYDDWINDEQWLLTKGIAFGYPPIPMSRDATLVVDTVTVNAVVDTYRDRYVRFAVSGIPRGGFSGGPVWHEWGFVLGMITESLEYQGDNTRLGYLTVLSIESLRECLEEHSMLPPSQRLEE